jgi:hypothetical protein
LRLVEISGLVKPIEFQFVEFPIERILALFDEILQTEQRKRPLNGRPKA